MNCPLCHSKKFTAWYQDHWREYYRCEQCWLVYVPALYYLTPECEKAEYDKHNNSPDDPAYRRFLSRLAEPLQVKLSPKSKGLDFGCGPGPTLSVMLVEWGHVMTVYDKYYAPQPQALQQCYDFITATEVVEHLYQPSQVFPQLLQCLKPNGLLAIMTKLVLSQKAFAGWHYKNDPTHVCFFSIETFEWLAAHYDLEVEFVAKDVIFLKPA